MVMASLTWKHPKKGFWTSKKKGYSLKSTTLTVGFCAIHIWDRSTGGAVPSHQGRQPSMAPALDHVDSLGFCTDKEQWWTTSPHLWIVRTPGVSSQARETWWTMSPPLWIVQTPGVSKQSGQNAEQHLHPSGLCEHLGFLHRQREQRWTSQRLWIVWTLGVSKQSENNAGVPWTMLPHLMQEDTKSTVVYEHPFMG